MAAMTRREAREEVFRLLFETEFHRGVPAEEVLSLAADDRGFDSTGYIRQVYLGVQENLAELDALIEKCLKGWALDRLAKVDLAILRVAAYELAYTQDTPDAVVIDEAVTLAKRFDCPQAGKFINGVLAAALACLHEEKGADA